MKLLTDQENDAAITTLAKYLSREIVSGSPEEDHWSILLDLTVYYEQHRLKWEDDGGTVKDN